MKQEMCSRCGKRPAVVFIQKMEGDNVTPQGLCINCARELNIGSINQMIDKLGISDEELEMASEQMANFMENMEISLDDVGGVSVVTLKGRLNVTTTAELEKTFSTLLSENKTKVLLDFRQLEYISSAGLRVLLAAAKQFKKVSGRIVLSSLVPSVKQVFEISGFTSIFPIFSTRDEAVKSF